MLITWRLLDNGNDKPEPPRLKPAQKPSFLTMLVLAVTLLGAGNFCLAAFGLIQERDVAAYIKIALISLAAFVVAFAVNKFAVEDGAPQAAKGYWSSGIISLAAVLTVGLSLFAATFAGQVIKPAEGLNLIAHGVALQKHATQRIRASRSGSTADRSLQTALNTLIAKRDCELQSGCISGRQAGPGPVTRGLDPLIAQAKGAIDGRGAQNAERQSIIVQVNRLLEQYRRIAAQSARDVYQRRIELEGLHGKIEQRLNELDGVQPVSVANAYVADLRRGVNIPGRPGAASRLNAILSNLADSIEGSLEDKGYQAKGMPRFPERVGVSDTFAYIGKFLPIAGVVFTVEALLPLLLWTFAYNGARWEIFQVEQGVAKDNLASPPIALSAHDLNEPGKTIPPVSGAAIDGPRGWSGRSRFNSNKLNDESGGEA